MKLGLLLAALFYNVSCVQSFAAWLKCYVDVTSPQEIIMNNFIIPSANAHTPGVEIEVKLPDDDHWFNIIEYDASSSPTTIMLRLKVPAQLANMDMQYVIESFSPQARFVPSKTCEGRRAHATHYGSSVALEISGGDTVELVAAYAHGHEAVTLTERLILKQKDVVALSEL